MFSKSSGTFRESLSHSVNISAIYRNTSSEPYTFMRVVY